MTTPENRIKTLEAAVGEIRVGMAENNANSAHLVKDLGDIKGILQENVKFMQKLVTTHEVSVTRLQDTTSYHQKKIDAMHTRVELVNANQSESDRRIDGMVNKAIGWSIGAGGTVAGGVITVAKTWGF